MSLRRCIVILIVLFSSFLLSYPGQTQDKKGVSRKEGKGVSSGKGFGFSPSRAPIDITSDTAEGDQKQNKFTFKGNVVAKQEDMTLYADTLVVYYDNETNRLKEIIATGNVKIVQLDRRANSKRATFFQNENKIVLEGDCVIRQGDSVIRGDRIVYLIDEERSYVEGGKGGRVTTTITPTSKEDKGK